MSLSNEERDSLVSLQIEKSKKHLSQADDMFKLGYYDMAANRYYYACFHALHAFMIMNGRSCHTHGGLIAEFGMHFIKTGIIDSKYGRFVSRLGQLREKSDYNCFYEVNEEDVKDMIEPAHEFIFLIESKIKKES